MSTKSASSVSDSSSVATEYKIFTRARCLNKNARNVFLNAKCDGDDSLKRRVEDLVSLADDASQLLNRKSENLLPDAHSSSSSSRIDQRALETILDSMEPTAGHSMGQIHQYEINEIIGYGAFGIVFRAYDQKLARQVAIKVLAPTSSSNLGQQAKFIQEARSAAAVKHGNIVQIYAVEESPFPYIVMELVSGCTLKDYIRDNGPLSSTHAVAIAIEIAKGLDAAHANGIVHLDVKPANILMESSVTGDFPRPKLTDFGIAFDISSEESNGIGVVMGTPAYMSPEQAAGEPLDQRADLFSLGSVLFAMCTGIPAFRGSETLSIVRGVLENQRMEIPNDVQIPKSLLRIIDRLHFTVPDQRYESAAKVIKDLQKVENYKKPANYSTWLLTLASLTVLVLVCNLFWSSSAKLSKSALVNGQAVVNSSAVKSWHDARQQLMTATSQLELLNVDFDRGRCVYEIVDGRLTELELPWIYDYTPVKALRDLERLKLTCSPDVAVVDLDFVTEMSHLSTLDAGGVPLKNLKPLQGLPLSKLNVWCSHFHCQDQPLDLSPLKAMPLYWLNCGGSKNDVDLQPLHAMKLEFLCINNCNVDDLSPLHGMPLHTLQMSGTQIDDLTPLADAPLKILELSNTEVRDLSPLIGMEFEELFLKDMNIDDWSVLSSIHVKALWLDYEEQVHREIVLTIPGLERLDGKPLAEFGFN